MSQNDPSRNKSSESDPSERQRIVDLVTHCLLEIEEAGSDEVAVKAATERFCARHPLDAEVIRRRIRILRGMGAFEPTPDPSQDDVDSEAPAAPPTPQRLGDFRLVRLLAQGGMGVIYLAVQESLDREVALKLIRPDLLYFPAARERFRREVEAVARMQHPSIVPVFTVGESQGLPWFAMELVRGCSANEALTDLRSKTPEELRGEDLKAAVAHRSRERSGALVPSDDAKLYAGNWIETCLRIAHEMLSGLDHAHRRGVLHRDLKPSNLMLTPEGRVLLVDFGLAVSTKRADWVSVTAGLVGSIPYMAPEQLDSKREIDERTDVYSAGVTLYELLTLRNPFLVTDDGPTATQQRILAGACPPLRSRNHEVNRDLEVVVAKAMALDPAERYSSAVAFQRDVENLLSHRPVDARPIALPTRLWRTVKRNPLTSGACALALGSVIALPTTFLLHEREASERIRAALETAETERGRAERNLLASLTTVDTMVRAVGADRTLRNPDLTPIRSELLASALGLYQAFLVDNAGNSALEVAFADTRRNAAALHLALGQLDLAIAEFERSRDAFDALHAANPDDLSIVRKAVKLGQDLVASLIRRGHLEDALVAGRRALEYSRPLRLEAQDADPEANADVDEIFLTCSRIENNLAIALSSLGKSEEARAALESSIGRLELLQARHPTAETIQRANIEARTNLIQLDSTKDPNSRLAYYEETTRLARRYRDADESDPTRAQLLANCLVNFATSHPAGDPRALELLREAIAIQETLSNRVIDPVHLLSERSAAQLALRGFLVAAGDLDGAVRAARDALSIIEEFRKLRAVPDYLLIPIADTAQWITSQPSVDGEAALGFADRVLATFVAEPNAPPPTPAARRALELAKAARINALSDLGRYAELPAMVDELLASVAVPSKWYFNAARTFALVHSQAIADTTTEASLRDPIAEYSRRRAFEQLRLAISEADVGRAQIEAESRFLSLRDDPEFRAIVESAP